MSSNEDYLDSLLKSMGNEGAADPNKKMSADEIEAMFAAAEMAASDVEEPQIADEPTQTEEVMQTESPFGIDEVLQTDEALFGDENVPTLDDIKEFSEDQIEQMLAATEQTAVEAEADTNVLSDEESADNDDLLALLGGLSDDEDINEITDLLNKDENNELLEESIAPAWDEEQGFVSEELGALLGGADTVKDAAAKKEEQRQKREEKKLEKQRQKQLKKEEKLRQKEGKRQQKEARKLVEELERENAEREAAQRDQDDAFETVTNEEAVGLFEAVNSADVVDIFGAQTSDAVATSDISSLLAELEDVPATGDEQAAEEPDFAPATEADAISLFGTADSEEMVDLFGNSVQEKQESIESVNIFGEETSADEMEFTGLFDAEEPEKAKPEKKKGLFSKLFNALTEEDPEDTISDENKAILDELDAEDKEASKKKKGKKDKADKKKGKGKDSEEENDEEEDGKGKGKGKGDKEKKKPKKVKPKKEKPAKAKPGVYTGPTKRVSKKAVLVIILFAATVFAIVYFAVNVLSDTLQLNSAKEAFGRQDYVACYEKLYGLELSEEEHEMFKHAELVMKMERRIAVYEKYMADEMELEALDSLMRGIASYEEMYNEALGYGAGPEVHAYYMEIIDILEEDYGLSQADAIAIAYCESNVQYTRYLTALLAGESVSVGNGNGADGSLNLPESGADDILPAEEELPNQNFAD